MTKLTQEVSVEHYVAAVADGSKGSLNHLIEELCNCREKIPRELRADASCVIEENYGSLYIGIHYTKEETDEEYLNCLYREEQTHKDQERRREERELTQYKALHLKYKDHPL